MSNERANEPILGDERNAIGAGQEARARAAGGVATTAFGLSDIGCQRSVNQDTLGNRLEQFSARTDDLGLLYAVADGMGGHARGEVASAIAIHELFARYYSSETGQPAQQTLARTMSETNAAVFEAGRAAGGGTMGTTLTTVLLRDNILYVGNIGDSRTYLIRAGKIKQLSHDHSLIGEQVRNGLLTEAQARASSIRNVITRAVGYRESVEPDTFAFTVQAGDILLLCSDGLHGLIENDELAQILSTKSLADATTELIALARERGGPDNITALVVRIDEIGAPAMSGPEERTTESFALPEEATTPLPAISPEYTDEIVADPANSAVPEDAETKPNPLIAPPPPAAAAPPAAVPPLAVGAAPAPPIASARHTAPAPTRQARPPIWLFVAIPLLLILLVAAGAFFVFGRSNSGPAATPVPSVSPAATAAATTAPPAGAVPLTVPTVTPTSVATVAASLSSPTPTSGLLSVPQPTVTSGTGGLPVLPRGTAVTPGTGNPQRVIISGTIRVDRNANPPQNFPNGWSVVLYNLADWQQRRQRADPKGRFRFESLSGNAANPFENTFPFGFEVILAAERPSDETFVLQIQQEGTTRTALTERNAEVTIRQGAIAELKVETIAITGFTEESEPGPSQTPRPGGNHEQPVGRQIGGSPLVD